MRVNIINKMCLWSQKLPQYFRADDKGIEISQNFIRSLLEVIISRIIDLLTLIQYNLKVI